MVQNRYYLHFKEAVDIDDVAEAFVGDLEPMPPVSSCKRPFPSARSSMPWISGSANLSSSSAKSRISLTTFPSCDLSLRPLPPLRSGGAFFSVDIRHSPFLLLLGYLNCVAQFIVKKNSHQSEHLRSEVNRQEPVLLPNT